MKKTIVAAAVAAALCAGPALAADLPNHKGPPVAPAAPLFAWTGFYGGVNIGGGWSNNIEAVNFFPFVIPPPTPVAPPVDPFFPFTSSAHLSGVIGGGQVGFNYQLTPMLVVGFETDFQGTSLSNTDTGLFSVPIRLNWFGTVRGRAGVALFDSRLLVYGTGGFAYGELEEHALFGENTRTDTGWTAGGGVEWAPRVLPNWSMKIEYLFTQLNRDSDNGFFFEHHDRLEFHTVRAGLNYHINLFPPAPVIASY